MAGNSSPRDPGTPGAERIFIGVAWPYANGPQHVGHLAGNLLPADIFARYHRLRGDEVLMVSGSDMHGTPTTVKADAEGVSPEVVANRYHAMNVDAFSQLGISFDLYTTTHTPTHERTVQEVFLTLLEKRYLEKRMGEYPYCEKDLRFLPDRYVIGTCPHCGSDSARGDECDACSRVLEPKDLLSPRCRTCGTPATFRPSEHFHFLLPKLAEDLKSYHDSVKDHWRPSVRTFTENYLAAGLRPRPITRDILWGVPLPLDGYEGKRIYVWFEAVIGYLSATREWAERKGEPDAWRRFWLEGESVRAYNFLGKDNITFHTILWPAILLAVGGLKLPYDVPANEFMNRGGHKLAKSRTSLEDEASAYLPDLLKRFDPDVLRFYVAYHMPQNHDTEYDLEDIGRERDQILADQWGNLIQRVLSFAVTHYGGRVPAPPPGWDPSTSPMGNRIRQAVGTITKEMEAVHLKEALETALTLVRDANRAFHEAKPWATGEPARTLAVYEALWAIRSANVLLFPYLPFASEKVAAVLGSPDDVRPRGWGRALDPPVPGTLLGKAVPLFPKPTREALPPPETGEKRLDIRVGLVQEVSPHPDADKLYVLKIDAGEPEPRTLVAGLRQVYRPEELLGKAVALLANLAPRKLRGITSQGMVLAADDGVTVSVLEAPPGTPPGTGLEGAEGPAAQISYDDFTKFRLEVDPDPGTGTTALVAVTVGADGSRTPVTLSTHVPLRPGRQVRPGSQVR